METNINFAVVIPWRRKYDRAYAYEIVSNWYKKNFPHAKIFSVDDGKEPFCLSGCRNLGVRQAEEERYNVVVINDADTIPEVDPLIKAVSLAMTNNAVYLPYTEYHSLMHIGTTDYLNGKPLNECRCLVVPGACSGVYVTSPKTWWKHYGQDERFRGWGFEDAAWWSAHTTLLGREPVRVEGNVYSFHHDSEKKRGKQYEANATLCAHYHAAQNDIERMKVLAAAGLGVD
jgi:predicted glycosyltransferase involved in capsule biosynthesis